MAALDVLSVVVWPAIGKTPYTLAVVAIPWFKINLRNGLRVIMGLT